MEQKLRLLGASRDPGRSLFIFYKDESFLEVFPQFLFRCGMRDLGSYGNESLSVEDRGLIMVENGSHHFQNDGYDIDVIYTFDRIFLIVRTAPENQDQLSKQVLSMTY